MSGTRDMTLAEYVGVLPTPHQAERDYLDLLNKIKSQEEQIARLRSDRDRLEDLLIEADMHIVNDAIAFNSYVAMHRAKATEEGYHKANVNQALADRCREMIDKLRPVIEAIAKKRSTLASIVREG